MEINGIELNKEDIDNAAMLASDAQKKANEAFELLKKYMTKPDETLVFEEQDIASELRGAILTLAGVDTLLSELSEQI